MCPGTQPQARTNAHLSLIGWEEPSPLDQQPVRPPPGAPHLVPDTHRQAHGCPACDVAVPTTGDARTLFAGPVACSAAGDQAAGVHGHVGHDARHGMAAQTMPSERDSITSRLSSPSLPSRRCQQPRQEFHDRHDERGKVTYCVFLGPSWGRQRSPAPAVPVTARISRWRRKETPSDAAVAPILVKGAQKAWAPCLWVRGSAGGTSCPGCR